MCACRSRSRSSRSGTRGDDDHDQGVVRDAHRAAQRFERNGPLVLRGREPRVGRLLMSRWLARRARGEHGQVVVLAALMIPVFLLLGALVVDAGNWYAHKRSLQNRADAGALAAGLQYVEPAQGLPDGARHDGDGDRERRQGLRGHERVRRSPTYNKNVNNQGNVTVAINATSPTAADWTDGGGPVLRPHDRRCVELGGAVDRRQGPRGEHRDAVRLVRHQPAADRRAGAGQSRADHRRRPERPAVRRRDRRSDRMRVGPVRARARRLDDGLHRRRRPTRSRSPSPRITRGRGTSRTSSSRTRPTTSRSSTGRAARTARRRAASPLRPKALCRTRSTTTVLRCRSTGSTSTTRAQAPGTETPPKLRRFSLSADNCGGPGFLYTASTDPAATCRVGFTAEVDTGVNDVRARSRSSPSARPSAR